MAQVIQFKRGLKEDLPATAAAGEPLFATDTGEVFIGTGSGVLPIVGTDEHVKVGAAGTKDYLSSDYFEQDGVNHIRIKQNTKLTGVDADKVDGKNVDDTGTTTDYLWTASKIQTVIDNATSGLASALKAPVADVTALKALDTTSATTYPDKILINVEATGLYRLDRDASDVGDDDRIVAPTTGIGRWFKMSASINDHNNASNLQGGTTGEYYHLTSDQRTGLTGSGATTLHKHSTDNLDEGTTNLFFTDERAQDAVGAAVTDTNSINFTYDDVNGTITAAVVTQNSNTVTLSIDASGVKAEVNVQDTNTIDLGSDASGLKADVKTQTTNTVTLGADASGLKADVKTQNSTSATITNDASGIKVAVNVDDATIGIDGTNSYLYVKTIDGGTF